MSNEQRPKCSLCIICILNFLNSNFVVANTPVIRRPTLILIR